MKLGLLASSFSPFPHPGIIFAMRQAMNAGVCDAVIAALHVDPSVERPEKRTSSTSVTDRTIMLEAIRYVAEVVQYRTEDDLRRIIMDRRPAVLILGEEYRGVAHTGNEFAIPVFYARRSPGWSGTEFARRIADSMKDQR